MPLYFDLRVLNLNKLNLVLQDSQWYKPIFLVCNTYCTFFFSFSRVTLVFIFTSFVCIKQFPPLSFSSGKQSYHVAVRPAIQHHFILLLVEMSDSHLSCVPSMYTCRICMTTYCKCSILKKKNRISGGSSSKSSLAFE